MLPKALSFSGGQTSGYMLRREIDRIGIDAYREQFRTIFCNTGREHEKTLDFVHQVETRWSVPVTWLEYVRVPAIEIDPLLVPEGRKRGNLIKAQAAGDGAHWFKVVDYATAARRGQRGPFDSMLSWAKGLPNVQTRRCSVQLKIRTRDRYLRSLGIGAFQSFIGIRADEAHRKLEILANIDQHEQPKFPLIDLGADKAEVDGFWDTHPFRLEIPNYEGNCDGCFLKANWKRILLAREQPQNAQWWADKEQEALARGIIGDAARWKAGADYRSTIDFAAKLPAGALTLPKPKGPRLWTQDEMDLSEPDIPCSCAVGGYRGGDED